MPLAAPLVSGDCAPPALEVHDGSLRQHSTTSWPAYSSEAVSSRLCARRHTGRALEDAGCKERDPDSWAPLHHRRWAAVACTSVPDTTREVTQVRRGGSRQLRTATT
jgi:hypothetical protein